MYLAWIDYCEQELHSFCIKNDGIDGFLTD